MPRALWAAGLRSVVILSCYCDPGPPQPLRLARFALAVRVFSRHFLAVPVRPACGSTMGGKLEIQCGSHKGSLAAHPVVELDREHVRRRRAAAEIAEAGEGLEPRHQVGAGAAPGPDHEERRSRPVLPAEHRVAPEGAE